MKFLRLVYNLLFPVVLILLLPGALLRMIRRGNYAHKFGQRFAMYSRRTRATLRREKGRWIWIHAVSVGEVNIALKFIEELQRDEDVPVLLSTTTSTGFLLASSRKKNGLLEVIYHPVDFLLSVKKAVSLIQPKALVLVEAEIWPNLVREVHKSGGRVMLLNARLSERSGRRYLRFRWLVAPLFGELDAVGVQNEKDAARFSELGVPAEKIQVTGSVKFDPEGPSLPDPSPCREILSTFHVPPNCKILLGASTHSGEESALAKTFLELAKTRAPLLLLLVPRHAERAKEILEELSALEISVARRSLPAPEKCPEILLVDSTGELPMWTQLADVVFVGKSLTAKGGQNPAEAIRAGKAVLFGPNMQNFSALADLLLSVDGGRQVETPEDLLRVCAELLDHPEHAAGMAAKAIAALEPHRGATRRSRTLLSNLLSLSSDSAQSLQKKPFNE